MKVATALKEVLNIYGRLYNPTIIFAEHDS